MKNVIGVEYLLRRNLGNYEHEELKIIDTVDKDDKVNGLKSVMAFVRDAIYGDGEFSDGAATNTVAKKPLVESAMRTPKAEPKPETKVETKAEPKPETKVETKAATKVEEKVETKTEPEPKPETKVATKVETKTPARKPETAVKVDKSVTVYDRTHQPHKTLIGQHLDKNFPNWKSGAAIEKAVAASHAMNGKAMLDKNGDFLESFVEEFNKLME